MDIEEAGLVKALEAEYQRQIKTHLRIFRMLLGLRKLTPTEQVEYDRILGEINAIMEERERLLKELEPLRPESATIEQRLEYAARITALLERWGETLAKLNKDLQRLLVTVAADDR